MIQFIIYLHFYIIYLYCIAKFFSSYARQNIFISTKENKKKISIVKTISPLEKKFTPTPLSSIHSQNGTSSSLRSSTCSLPYHTDWTVARTVSCRLNGLTFSRAGFRSTVFTLHNRATRAFGQWNRSGRDNLIGSLCNYFINKPEGVEANP